jgi:hypothetical protein
MSRTISPDREQTLCPINIAFAPQTRQTFAYGLSNGRGEALSGQFGKLLGEPARLFVFDIHAHGLPFYHNYEHLYHPGRTDKAPAVQTTLIADIFLRHEPHRGNDGEGLRSFKMS